MDIFSDELVNHIVYICSLVDFHIGTFPYCKNWYPLWDKLWHKSDVFLHLNYRE